MSKIDRKTLKSYFQSGKIPTEEQFADLIDSVPNWVDDDEFDLVGTNFDSIQRINFRNTRDGSVAWSLCLTPEKNLSLTNERGEVLAEFMQDQSIKLHGRIIREETPLPDFPEKEEESPAPDEQPKDEDTSTDSAGDGNTSADVDNVIYNDAILDPKKKACYIVPTDTEWYNIPIEMDNKVSVNVCISVYGQGQKMILESYATLMLQNDALHIFHSKRKSHHALLDYVDIRWYNEQRTLQMCSKKLMASGEVKCYIVGK